MILATGGQSNRSISSLEGRLIDYREWYRPCYLHKALEDCFDSDPDIRFLARILGIGFLRSPDCCLRAEVD